MGLGQGDPPRSIAHRPRTLPLKVNKVFLSFRDPRIHPHTLSISPRTMSIHFRVVVRVGGSLGKGGGGDGVE